MISQDLEPKRQAGTNPMAAFVSEKPLRGQGFSRRSGEIGSWHAGKKWACLAAIGLGEADAMGNQDKQDVAVLRELAGGAIFPFFP